MNRADDGMQLEQDKPGSKYNECDESNGIDCSNNEQFHEDH
jgi:hypothetical protein